MTVSFDDWSSATRMRDIIKDFAKSELQNNGVYWRYGSVSALNRDTLTADIMLNGDTGTTRVNMCPGLQPNDLGSIVRVEGNPGDMWITAIIKGKTYGVDSDNGSKLLLQTFSTFGPLTAGSGNQRWYTPTKAQVIEVFAAIGTTSSGSSVTVDLKKNGGSMLASPIVISPGSNTGSGFPNTLSLNGPNADYCTVDVITIGSGTPGSDLVVQIYGLWTPGD